MIDRNAIIVSARAMNQAYIDCKNNNVDNVTRLVCLFIDDQLFYSVSIDDMLTKFDEQYAPNPISVNDTDFINLLLDIANKLIRSDIIGSGYLTKIANDGINIKVCFSTVCSAKYADPQLIPQPGIFRP